MHGPIIRPNPLLGHVLQEYQADPPIRDLENAGREHLGALEVLRLEQQENPLPPCLLGSDVANEGHLRVEPHVTFKSTPPSHPGRS